MEFEKALYFLYYDLKRFYVWLYSVCGEKIWKQKSNIGLSR